MTSSPKRSQLKTNAALSKEFGSTVPQTVTPTSTAAGFKQTKPQIVLAPVQTVQTGYQMANFTYTAPKPAFDKKLSAQDAAFLESQMESISSQIPYSITPEQYAQYIQAQRKEMLAAIPKNMGLPYIEPVQECRYEVRGYNLNCALPFQGGKLDWGKAVLYDSNLQPKQFVHNSSELYTYVQPDAKRPLAGAADKRLCTIIQDL